MTSLQNLVSSWKTEGVEWQPFGNSVCYIGEVAGETLLLTLNNFPDEPLFTVFGLDDAIDLDGAVWKLGDQKTESGYDEERVNAIKSRLLNHDGKIEWMNTHSPLVFKSHIDDQVVYWKFNVESASDYTLVTPRGAVHLDKVPDSWVIQK